MIHYGDVTKINGAEVPTVDGEYKVYKYIFPDGKIYIGTTKMRIEDRRDCGYNHNIPLKTALKRYGWRGIKKEVLKDGMTQEEAFEYEKRMIAEQRANDPEIGFNVSLGGKSTYKGLKHSEEYKKKMSELYKGKTFSEETLVKMKEAHATERFPAYRIDDKGERVRFESITAAAKSVNGYPANVTRASRENKKYKGFRWEIERRR